MSIPDYREAAYCGRCHWCKNAMNIRCLKHNTPVDWLHICADFVTEAEIVEMTITEGR